MPRMFLLASLISVALALTAGACNRNEEPISTSPHPAPGALADAAHKPPPTPTTEGRSATSGPRTPDWALDPSDAAGDYVKRYLRATGRYGTSLSCIVVGPSTFAAGHSVVETRNDASGACGVANGIRDRFLVTIATDRMTLDDSLHQPPLKAWPDGSSPDGPPSPVIDIQDLRAWKTDLHETLKQLQLAPIRVQLYGRGTYPVVTLAGWHAPLLRSMSPAELAEPAIRLCTANDGQPLGIFGGLDRAVLLRVRCPASASFESM
jgi:hypothetical protein